MNVDSKTDTVLRKINRRIKKTMYAKTLETKYFRRKEEEAQNPYIGFTSFQHFRDEALYSDIVVKPENNMTETENVEGYPIPDYVEQNGREEGFYPDTTVAYIRILWKEFEPRQGEYCFEIIEEILSKAKLCGQTVMFRLMAHSTRASDDVPDWLKKIIPCPERPEGKRVKDSPKEPEYLEFFGRAIYAIGERFDDDPVLDAVDISLTGAWGEGHQIELYPREALKKLMDVYISAFRKTSLIGQSCAPWLIDYVNARRPIGWRGDGIGEPGHMRNFYPERAVQMTEVWKKGPVSFESYWWLGEWKRKGWDIDQIIEQTLEWHVSTFNAKSLPIPNEWREKIQYWNSKMGYHFAIEYFKYPVTCSLPAKLDFEICIHNYGVAPIYNYIPVKIRLINKVVSYEFNTDIDIRKWLPGKLINKILICLSEEISYGKYDIEIGIFGDDMPMIYLATDAVRNGKYYAVGEIEIAPH